MTEPNAREATQQLDIDAVLNESVNRDRYLLYALPLDYEEAYRLITNMKNEFEANAPTSIVKTRIDKIDSTLSKTNSEQFYLGTEAKKNIDNIKYIGELIKGLTNNFNELDIKNLEETINKYNETLKKLKKEVRRELLETAAAKFNAELNEYDGFPKEKKYKFVNGKVVDDDEAPNPTKATQPAYDSTFNCLKDDNMTKYKKENLETKNIDTDGNDGYEIIINNYKIHKYKQITCTSGLEHIQSCWDPTFEEIEAQFRAVGCEIPYDTSLVANDEKNNAWHWNQGGANS